jgi:hypothetical protein
MKIIKSFEDPEYFESYYNFHGIGISETIPKTIGRWYWGLGADGEIYYHSTVNCKKDVWYEAVSQNYNKLNSLKTIIKITHEFEEILAFL